jgi:hypothetical protein
MGLENMQNVSRNTAGEISYWAEEFKPGIFASVVAIPIKGTNKTGTAQAKGATQRLIGLSSYHFLGTYSQLSVGSGAEREARAIPRIGCCEGSYGLGPWRNVRRVCLDFNSASPAYHRKTCCEAICESDKEDRTVKVPM